MPEPRLSVIVPTLGRETLRATLESIAPQLDDRDEVIVAADTKGDRDRPYELVREIFYGKRWIYLGVEDDGRGHGYRQREQAIETARGTHLCFLDDDDTYRPAALSLFREHAAAVPVIFRMAHPLLGTLWREPTVAYGNVGTPMFLIPNEPGRLGRWEPHIAGRAGDYTFIQGCVDELGGPVWRPEVVADISPAGAAEGSHVAGAAHAHA